MLGRRVIAPVVVATGLLALLVVPVRPAESAVTWAPMATATIHPGARMVTAGAQCTANFVFTRTTSTGTDVYLGYAAHCAASAASTTTNGCDVPLSQMYALGTPVQIEGASQAGTLVYSSWRAMKSGARPSAAVCQSNDFAVVRVATSDKARVNPSMPFWGGPTGLNTTGNPQGSAVYSIGNSDLRQGIDALKAKQGVSLGTTSGGWAHPVYTVTPGIPGDSGSGLLDKAGRATGVLSSLTLAPLAGSNGFIDLYRALAYAQTHGMSGLTLAKGTMAFNPDLVRP